MSLISRLFRWRSRITTGAPEAGSVVTLAGHVADENAHPSYLKKGQAVPTGQEHTVMAKHRADPLAHAKHNVRRSELMRTLDDYHAARDYDLSNVTNNFTSLAPQSHVVTAYVLQLVLSEAISTKQTGVPFNLGDGTQLFVSDENGVLKLSTASAGSNKRPVYLSNGKLTPIAADAVMVSTNQTIGGTKTFSSIPTVSSDSVVPARSTDLTTKKYVDQLVYLPINFVVTTSIDINTPAAVKTAIGYGTWELMASVGKVGYMWKRTA